MADRRTPEEAAWFTDPGPGRVHHRRYEALRSYFVDRRTVAQAAAEHGYTHWAMADLIRDHRAGKVEPFAPKAKPGPPKGAAPAKDKARGRAVELRRTEDLSVHEISRRLAEEGTPLNRTSVAEILKEEGFGRLLRRPHGAASASPATPGRDTALPRARALRARERAPEGATRNAGMLLAVPDLIALDLPGAVAAAGYPSTRAIPAANMAASLLALKLAGARRVSHVDDFLADPAVALFAGMAALPKKSALTAYSYRTSRRDQEALLRHLAAKMAAQGMTGPGGVLNLDFHAIMHWGEDPVLEKHYVPKRSQRARSVLSFFAEDQETGNLVWSDADILKAGQADEPITFCDQWKAATGKDPRMLVMDQKVTTGKVLGALDSRGVKFITLRVRQKPLLEQIAAVPKDQWKTIALDRARHNRPKIWEDPAARLTGYPGTVRQIAVTGLGHDQPTVIVTNDRASTARQTVDTYAHRMGIEQRLAEIIRAFGADALSSTVNLNVDLDLALCVWAHAATAHLADRLPGYARKAPDTLQRRFLETPGEITQDQHGHVTVRLDRRAYQPTLRQADLPQDVPVPWWGGRTLSYRLD
jgi:hypothetical protein